MASLAEIRSRINSIKKTQKITGAMYLIASTKYQKANRILDNSRSYFDGIKNDLKTVLFNMPDIKDPLFYPDGGENKNEEITCGLLVITGDKGLCGAYNSNVLKEAQKYLDKYNNVRLFVVGEYGRTYYDQKDIATEEGFFFSPEHATVYEARKIAKILLDEFKEKRIDILHVIYTQMGKANYMSVRDERLLPFEKNNDTTLDMEIVPSPKEVLSGLIESYINGYIYGVLADSFCSEQRARMEAMDSANENAEELLSKLKLQFNRARQAAITMEITEVSAGALAQRKKREDKS